MASYAEIANDLHAQRACVGRRGSEQSLKLSLARGAEAIHELLRIKADLEAAAEAEAMRYEAYVNGGGHEL